MCVYMYMYFKGGTSPLWTLSLPHQASPLRGVLISEVVLYSPLCIVSHTESQFCGNPRTYPLLCIVGTVDCVLIMDVLNSTVLS